MTERAPAKINLCLFLGPTRPQDARHELVSVMQSLTLADELTMTAAAGEADEVVCPGVEGPNLAAAALAAFREETGWDGPPQRVEIVKRIPVAAGMGGGSGDAAAVLRLAARAAGGGVDDELLRAIGARLGADVPAQVRPGRSLATGMGERVEALADGPPFGVLVLPGERPLATGAVYAEADRLGLPRAPEALAERHAAVRAAVAATGALPRDFLVNDLEAAALSLQPAIEQALEAALAVGADHAMVSGSGPTVLGLFFGADGGGRARVAAAALGDRRPAPLTAAPEPGW